MAYWYVATIIPILEDIIQTNIVNIQSKLTSINPKVHCLKSVFDHGMTIAYSITSSQ